MNRQTENLRTIAVGIVNYEKSLLELNDEALKEMQKYNTDIPNDSGDENE